MQPFTAHAASDRGSRSSNEDAFAVDVARGLMAVADGVGGEPGGAVASSVAVTSMLEYFGRAELSSDEETLRTRMRVAVGIARQAVVTESVGPWGRMATTLAAVWVTGRQAIVAHVGDSAVFLWRDEELVALTRDHAQQLAVASGMTRSSSALTRALGTGCDCRPDLSVVELRRRDVLVLCTDGVSHTLGLSGVAAILATAPAPICARLLVADSLARGGRDNATAIVAVVE